MRKGSGGLEENVDTKCRYNDDDDDDDLDNCYMSKENGAVADIQRPR
jgi:hypothetical protein